MNIYFLYFLIENYGVVGVLGRYTHAYQREREINSVLGVVYGTHISTEYSEFRDAYASSRFS